MIAPWSAVGTDCKVSGNWKKENRSARTGVAMEPNLIFQCEAEMCACEVALMCRRGSSDLYMRG